MINKLSSFTLAESELDRARAKILYEFYLRNKEINVAHPVMSTIKLAPLTNHINLWKARQSAFVANLPKSEAWKASIPFIGMGKRGQNALEDLMQKTSGYTEHGSAMQRSRALAAYDTSKHYGKFLDNNTKEAIIRGYSSAPTKFMQIARTEAFASEQRGLSNLKTLNPFIGISSQSEKSLDRLLNKTPNIIRHKEESTMNSSIPGTITMMAGSMLPQIVSPYFTNNKNMQAGGSVELDEKIIKYFKEVRGVNPKIDHTLDTAATSHFNPFNNEIKTSPRASAILAHELGHADNLKQFKQTFGETGGLVAQISGLPILQKMNLGGFERISPIGYVAAAPFLFDSVSNKLKTNDDESMVNKAVSTIQKYPEIPISVATLPLLIEEGRASAKAWNAIKAVTPVAEQNVQFKNTLKVLGPAFGTYVAASTIPIGAAMIYGARKRQNLKEEQSK